MQAALAMGGGRLNGVETANVGILSKDLLVSTRRSGRRSR